MTNLEKRNKMLSCLKEQKKYRFESGAFCIGNRIVCNKFYCEITGIKQKVIKRVIKDFSNGVQQYEPQHLGKTEMDKTLECISWCKNYFNMVGETSPETNKIRLPSYLNKTKIYVEPWQSILQV